MSRRFSIVYFLGLLVFSFIENSFLTIMYIFSSFAPNLVSWVLRKVISLEMVKNDIRVGGARKQMLFFSENVSQKNGPMAAMP